MDQAAEAWEQAAQIYADELKAQPDDLDLLGYDAELALVQGDISRLHVRIEAAQPQLSPDNELFVLLPFFAWLARPEQGWEPVLTAIEALEPEASFNWNFFTTTPAIERQAPQIQEIAVLFITFFEGKLELPDLKTGLEKYSSPSDRQ